MAVKILSVDDEVDLELLLTQYFRRKIRKGEYEFYFAHNGLEALQTMLQHPDIEIILSDINMPEMDGLTLLARINEMRNPAIRVIMVSAYGDMDNIRQAMNNGAFDFATKPIDLEDLERTIEKAVEQLEFVHSAQKDSKELKDIHSDLSVAREIQQAILPHNFDLTGYKLQTDCASGYRLAASMEAAKDVGGDFYDFFAVDPTHLGFVMADVSGKGVPAAIFMAVSRTLIKATGMRGITSSECMSTVNDMLADESVNSMFVTVFYGIIDLETGEIDYTNAGHNPPYIVHNNGQVEEIPTAGNMVLGAFDGIEFRSGHITLAKGETIYLFTDGVTEAENMAHEQYGEEKLTRLLSKTSHSAPDEIIHSVLSDIHDFVKNAPQSDDITQLSIRRL
ncbi:MAG: SpoIIE family protein phosphatase [Bacteroidaceae bacterium]|nr:SpoIIE family protein phosphatase [Bacteroidaceae bacterium]